MTKSESFNWQRTSKVCNGLYDFGLLRDKPSVEEKKPKIFPFHVSKTIFIFALIAGFALMICLIVADKYQKSAAVASHHYESFVYDKDRAKFQLATNERNATRRADESVVNALGLRKIHNISTSVPIDEINQLMPITTILRPVNVNASNAGGSSDRNSRTLADGRAKWPNLNELNKNVGDLRLLKTGGAVASKAPVNLAELLKRTEAKSPADAAAKTYTTSTEADTAMQFAQLESYRHYYNAKNLQDLMKYVSCHSAEECRPKFRDVRDGDDNDDQQQQAELPLLQDDQIRDEDLGLDDHDRIQVIIFVSVLFALLILLSVYTFLATIYL